MAADTALTELLRHADYSRIVRVQLYRYRLSWLDPDDFRQELGELFYTKLLPEIRDPLAIWGAVHTAARRIAKAHADKKRETYIDGSGNSDHRNFAPDNAEQVLDGLAMLADESDVDSPYDLLDDEIDASAARTRLYDALAGLGALEDPMLAFGVVHGEGKLPATKYAVVSNEARMPLRTGRKLADIRAAMNLSRAEFSAALGIDEASYDKYVQQKVCMPKDVWATACEMQAQVSEAQRIQVDAWRSLNMRQLVDAWLEVLRATHPDVASTLSELGRVLQVNKSTVMRWTNGQKPELIKLRAYAEVMDGIAKRTAGGSRSASKRPS